MKKFIKKTLNFLGIDIVRVRKSSRYNDIPNDGLNMLVKKTLSFAKKLDGIRAANSINKEDGVWFPHRVLGNFDNLNQTLTGKNRNLKQLIGNAPIADIGGADGELSFFLEANGFKDIHLIDYSKLSCNKQQGAKILKSKLNSKVKIYDINVDTHFELPHKRYGLIFLLGLFYHLKNPFYILENLAQCSKYCVLSTRITKFLPAGNVKISEEPVAYLLSHDELNQDASNYWIFTETSLVRILNRAGWDILDFNTFDNTVDSVPASLDKGERAFVLVRSREFK